MRITTFSGIITVLTRYMHFHKKSDEFIRELWCMAYSMTWHEDLRMHIYNMNKPLVDKVNIILLHLH